MKMICPECTKTIQPLTSIDGFCTRECKECYEARQMGFEMGEAEAREDILMTDQTWPLKDIVRQLVDATNHLLSDHDCDKHGYEKWMAARDEAEKWLVVRSLEDGTTEAEPE